MVGSLPQALERKVRAMVKPRAIADERRLNGKQRIVVIVMNLLLLAELTYCMYVGHQESEYMASFFLRTFFPMVIATVVLARLLVRKFHSEKIFTLAEDENVRLSEETNR